jgi:uncharacterized membrane protein
VTQEPPSEPPAAPPPPPPPPPPPSGEPYGSGGGAAAPFSVGESVSYGWSAYWKNVGPMLVLTIVIIAVNVVISSIGQAVDSVVLSLLISAIGWIVSLLLALGLIRASLAVTRGEKPEVGMLFDSAGFGPYILATILFGIGVTIGLILCVIPGIIFGIAFMFYGYLIAENPDRLGPTDALKRAAEISKGHRWELFGLGIVLILINIVGLIACFVGVIFTYGITSIAVAYAYRSLSGQSVQPV